MSSPYDNISNKEWIEIVNLVNTLKQAYGEVVNGVNRGATVNLTLQSIWEWTDTDRYKVPFAHPSLGLLPLLRRIIAEERSPLFTHHAFGCLWYMSRNKENDVSIADPALGLIPILMGFLRQDTHDRVYKILRNCVFHPNNHGYMLSDEIGYVEYWKTILVDDSDSIDPFHVFSAVASTLRDCHVHLLTKWRIHELIFHRIVNAGIDPSNWLGRDCGIEDHGLTFLTSFSTIPQGRRALLDLNPFPFLSEVGRTNTIEGIRCTMILFNLYGKEQIRCYDIIAQPSSFLITQQLCNRITREIYQYYADILTATINQDEGMEASILHLRGYDYGMFMLRDITLFFLHLGLIHPLIRYFILQDDHLIESFLIIIDAFITNEDEFAADNDVAKIFAGGGGMDQETMENVIEVLIQLTNLYWEETPMIQERSTKRDSPNWIKPLSHVAAQASILRFLKQYNIRGRLSNIFEVHYVRPLNAHLMQLLEALKSNIDQIDEDKQSKSGGSTARSLMSKFDLSNTIGRIFRSSDRDKK